MRALRALCCAVAITACLAPGARADEFTKQTFLTFSGPVQLPGITLAAGTYQFKLADPEFGRTVLQVWDKDGAKLLTTLLTIPDHRMTATSEPVVMFSERPSGQPQAIRAWFYPSEQYGQEFVYPKDQAMRIAQQSHRSVLAYEGDAKDEAAYKSAKVGRVDENGKMTDLDKAETTTAPNSAAAPAAAAAAAAPAAAPEQSAANATTAPTSSANRSQAPAAVGTSGTTVGNSTSEANRDNTNVDQRAVGTTGAAANANSANRTAQAAAGANAAAPRATQSAAGSPAAAQPANGTRELPRTAGSMTLVQLLAALLLAAAFAVRALRTRSATSR